jgi:hypothetical protein
MEPYYNYFYRYMTNEFTEAATSGYEAAEQKRINDAIRVVINQLSLEVVPRTQWPKIPTTKKQALKFGTDFYISRHPCKYCGAVGLRRQSGGVCYFCNDIRHPTAEQQARIATNALMKNHPDMVISRKDARIYGFKVYRTGKPCHHGHTGFRYVSTGRCVECIY